MGSSSGHSSNQQKRKQPLSPSALSRSESTLEMVSPSFSSYKNNDIYHHATSNDGDKLDTNDKLNYLFSDSSYDEDFDFIAEQQALVDCNLTSAGSTKSFMLRKILRIT